MRFSLSFFVTVACCVLPVIVNAQLPVGPRSVTIGENIYTVVNGYLISDSNQNYYGFTVSKASPPYNDSGSVIYYSTTTASCKYIDVAADRVYERIVVLHLCSVSTPPLQLVVLSTSGEHPKAVPVSGLAFSNPTTIAIDYGMVNTTRIWLGGYGISYGYMNMTSDITPFVSVNTPASTYSQIQQMSIDNAGKTLLFTYPTSSLTGTVQYGFFVGSVNLTTVAQAHVTVITQALSSVQINRIISVSQLCIVTGFYPTGSTSSNNFIANGFVGNPMAYTGNLPESQGIDVIYRNDTQNVLSLTSTGCKGNICAGFEVNEYSLSNFAKTNRTFLVPQTNVTQLQALQFVRGKASTLFVLGVDSSNKLHFWQIDASFGIVTDLSSISFIASKSSSLSLLGSFSSSSASSYMLESSSLTSSSSNSFSDSSSSTTTLFRSLTTFAGTTTASATLNPKPTNGSEAAKDTNIMGTLMIYKFYLLAAAILVLLVVCALFTFCYRALARREKRMQSTNRDGDSASYYADENSTQMSSYSSITAMMNVTSMMTQVGTVHEVSIPGFLNLKMEQDVVLENQIATGGGGDVFIAKALHRDLIQRAENTIIIAKTIHVNPDHQSEQEAQFYQEISLMYMLRDSPHFGKLVGYCETPMTILMRFYPHGSLDRFVSGAATGKLQSITYNKKLIVGIMLDISRGLMAMHGYGVVHSDIKPPNVLVEVDSNGNLHGLLADLGIARVVDNSKALVQSFKWSEFMGASLMYASPQQLSDMMYGTSLNMKPAEAKASDVYATGIVMLEMMCRQIKWQ